VHRQLASRPGQLELRAGSRDQHRELDRFGDVVGGALVQSALLVLFAVERSHEYHRDVGGERVLPQLREHGMAVHPGHHDVEQDQVRLRGQRRVAQCDRTGVRGPHVRAFPVQHLGQQGQVRRHVVDHQDQRAGAVGGDQRAFGLRVGRFHCLAHVLRASMRSGRPILHLLTFLSVNGVPGFGLSASGARSRRPRNRNRPWPSRARRAARQSAAAVVRVRA